MINLFNIANGKTKDVIVYIENLEEPISFTVKQSKKFIETKKEALKPGLTANRMLEIIGYNPTGQDGILES